MYLELANSVESGDCNALDSYIALKKAQDEITEAIKKVQPYALTEAEKYGQKSFEAFGAKIELRNGPSTYSFCGTITDIEKKLKYYKDMSKVGQFADPETGELIEAAIKIEGKPTIAISFK